MASLHRLRKILRQNSLLKKFPTIHFRTIPDSIRRWVVNRVLKFLAGIRIIRFELLVALLGLVLALGQYFQSGINIRISITSIWREGFPAETRNRVARFISLSSKWKNPDDSVSILVDPDKILEKDSIRRNANICNLVNDELEAILYERKKTNPEINLAHLTDKDYALLTNEDYIRATLKYRNAIIESLNTFEAVKAVIDARPLPFRTHLVYKDTLEMRYKDTVEDFRSHLEGFVQAYRTRYPRKTEAWHVLTDDPSYKDDYVVALVFMLVMILILTLLYFAKKVHRKYTTEPPS